MNLFEKKFSKKEDKYRRNYEIDDTLYSRLEELANTTYDATVTDLINACLEYLIETENIDLYKKDKQEITLMHTVNIKESNLTGLERLKGKYGVSICKLVNISIRNVLIETEGNIPDFI